MTDNADSNDVDPVEYLRSRGWELHILFGWRDPENIWIWMNQEMALKTQRNRDLKSKNKDARS